MIRRFRHLSVGHRLGLAFGAVVLLMLAVAAAGKLGLDRMQTQLHAITDDHAVKVFHTNAVLAVVNQQARSVRNLMILQDPAAVAGERRRIDTTRAEATALYEKLAEVAVSREEREALGAVTERRAGYGRELEEYLRLFDAGRADDARTQLVTRLRDRQLDYMQALQRFADGRREAMVAAGRESDRVTAQATWAMAAAALAGALLATGAGWLATRSITRPIGQAVEVAQRVAAGDLSTRIDVDGSDEPAHLLRALQTMTDQLGTLVAGVRAGSDSIATGSAQIATGSADLSQRTEEQASNLQQTAASMEQLTATVRTSADTAAQATQLAATAATSATDGGEVVREVVGTMQRISESSRRIAEIIGVIDGIAFQTNILALNAAVEAARAGEQGRGFAVVAGEVRALAQRSAQAAREIKSLIADSVDKVEAGTQLADRAGLAMTDIVGQVRRVSDLIGELGSSARQQTQGIDQINGAVSQLDQVTQQNAALVEQSTAAAESLRDQANRLVGAVARFRLREPDATAA